MRLPVPPLARGVVRTGVIMPHPTQWVKKLTDLAISAIINGSFVLDAFRVILLSWLG